MIKNPFICKANRNKNLKELIAVFIGSGLGGMARFLLSRWVSGLHTPHFPFGTLAVNLTACFILGFVTGLAGHKQLLPPGAKLFLVVGFCGGFSTFSAFSSETLTLFQQGNTVSSFLYILASVLLCLGATFCGLVIAERI